MVQNEIVTNDVIGQCRYQATNKGNLAKHKRAVHEGVKYHCRQCGYYQETTKGSLAEHKRALHVGVKYPCGQCGYQETTKGNLNEHKRAVHEGVKYPCGQFRREILLSIKWLCMKK